MALYLRPPIKDGVGVRARVIIAAALSGVQVIYVLVYAAASFPHAGAYSVSSKGERGWAREKNAMKKMGRYEVTLSVFFLLRRHDRRAVIFVAERGLCIFVLPPPSAIVDRHKGLMRCAVVRGGLRAQSLVRCCDPTQGHYTHWAEAPIHK